MKRKLFLAALFVASALGMRAQTFTDGGKYYLKNVEANRWWGAGNSWGTQASLVKNPEYVILHKSDDAYTLESQVSNGGNAIYFDGDYMDNGSPKKLTITAVDGGYTIADGTNLFGYDGASTILGKNIPAGPNTIWQIYSEDEMRAQLATATEENPVDATWLILDPNFGRNNRNVGAWTQAGSFSFGGDNSNLCIEVYRKVYTLSQTLSNVPNGVYTLTAQGFYRQDGNDNDNLPCFYINHQQATLPLLTGNENSMNDASASFSQGKYEIAPIKVLVCDNTITLGSKLTKNELLWCIFDNFQLTYHGPATPEVLSAELADAIAKAEKLQQTTVTTQEGLLDELNTAKTNAAANNTEEALTKLWKAISDVEASIASYQVIESGEVPMNDHTGWAISTPRGQLAINTWSNEGNTDGSNMTTPFMQNWVGKGTSLGAGRLYYTMEGLNVGEKYTVQALTRVLKEDGGATSGVAFFVNDQTKQIDGNGTPCTNGQYATLDLTAEVTSEGKLEFGLEMSSSSACNWVAMKNIVIAKYVEDVTIELDQNDIALTLAQNSVKLTATVSEGQTVAWTTGDPNVATVTDGVVTGVAPGTTTIRATVVGHEDVYAEATVTATYAESEMPEPDYENNNATRTLYMPGDNLIKNGSFEYGDPFYGWTNAASGALAKDKFKVETEGDEKYLVATTNDGSTGAGSLRMVWEIEKDKTYTFSYRVKALAEGAVGKEQGYLVTSLTNTVGTETKNLGKPTTTAEWTTKNYTFTNTDGYKYVQICFRWLDNQFGFDNFYLSEITETTEIGNVQYALDAIPQVNIGEGAFQYSQDAIDAARLLVQGEAGVEDVEEAHKALQTLNQPKEGQLFNVINVSANYDHANKALTFKSAANADLTQNTTAMSWGEMPGSIYPQAVKFTPVEGTLNEYTMSYTRADGQNVYIATANGSGLGTDTKSIRPTTDASKALKLRVEASTKENVWYLWNTENGKRIGANGKNDAGFFTGEANNLSYYDMKLTEAAKTNYALTVAAENQYGTLIVPFDTEIPEDLTVYAVNETEGSLLTLKTVDEIKANVPYIVFAESGIATTTLSGLGNAYTDTEYTEGLLTGLYAEKEITEGYVLQNQGGVVAFYQVNAEKPVKVTANRAYLKATDGIDVKGAYFFDDEATGIQNVLNAFTTGNVEVFNASGVRQNGLQKGLNIIRMEDGSVRKVMVK